MQRVTNPRTGAWIQFSTEGDDMVLERVMKPHTGKADPHRHLDYVESFEVVEGTATVVVDGRTIEAGPGERVEIPVGVPHRNAYNATGADLHLRHRAAPGSPFVEAFVSALGHHMEAGTVNGQGEFPQLQLFVTLHGTRGQSFLPTLPIVLQKPVIALVALIGRLRGYKPRY
jgi:mannose-6-phosphate isomerase-like protein (cupin superfamily)